MNKIGEVISASVLGGTEIKLDLDNPEDLKVGYPVIVEGEKYDFYCIIQDIMSASSEIIERIANTRLLEGEGGSSLIPLDAHDTYTGGMLASHALLRAIQLIDQDGELHEPETIPPYLSHVRLASAEDAERIYIPTDSSRPLGSLRGVPEFQVSTSFDRLTEKPFAIFGRTGAGKTILNKIVCNHILSTESASIMVFDMHQEYGLFSKTDNTPGVKYFHPQQVEMFTLDPANNREARPFIIDPDKIAPSDIIVAFQDLSSAMIDALYAVNKNKGSEGLVSAIKKADPEGDGNIHPAALQALQRRISRLDRFRFITPTDTDVISSLITHIKSRKSIIIDFGTYGTETTAYLFIANVIARRLYNLYTEQSDELPRLVLFLEEAHKFLDPSIASYTIFSRLARETRKFNLILALIDQRPSRIDDEVRSQLANRLVLSLKEPNDITSALSGVPDRSMWENIVGIMPPRNVLVVGDAIRIPTVMEVLNYTVDTMKTEDVHTSKEIMDIAKDADEIFDN